MPTTPDALWSLFLAGAVSLAIVVAAMATAMVIAQRRRSQLQRDSALRVAAAHEEERANIARELHDDALQRVAMIRHELEELWTPLSGAAGPREALRLRALNAELLDLGVTLRALAQRLHPTIVDQLGLPRALETLGGEFSRAGLLVQVTLPEEQVTLEPPVAQAAYRIAQEALRNVQKHAEATGAELVVSSEPRALVVRVRDRGRGFSAGRASMSSGLGIRGMRERAAQAGGTLSVLSHPGEGTTVEAVLPRTVAS